MQENSAVAIQQQIDSSLQSLRHELLHHPIYDRVTHLEQLRTFMSQHVFAVWDFMSLLKRLKNIVVPAGSIWLPAENGSLSRFVNEIVLGEESDEDGDGQYCSHFELYLRAMRQVGADSTQIRQLIHHLRSGNRLSEALEKIQLAPATLHFVQHTFEVIERGLPHEVAAVFCYGREDVIPEMFQCLEKNLVKQGQPTRWFSYYLQRHIELDGDHHGPLARQMVVLLCEDEPIKIQQAIAAAQDAIKIRIQLWDGLLEWIDSRSRSPRVESPHFLTSAEPLADKTVMPPSVGRHQ